MSSIGSTELFIDARIPVDFLARAPERPWPGRALLLSPSAPLQPVGWLTVVRLPPATGQPPGTTVHGSGCACCTGRHEQATALTLLFHARAKGAVAFFTGVVAVLLPEEAAVLRGLLQSDPFVSGCYVATDTRIEQ
ncbi:hypothetical protein [Lichenicoccus sp.]|uniref:hypothetical protein n=1 Tax=Lichenicoccus sp. TaxID=2781899 RepID=UPI003D099FB9